VVYLVQEYSILGPTLKLTLNKVFFGSIFSYIAPTTFDIKQEVELTRANVFIERFLKLL